MSSFCPWFWERERERDREGQSKKSSPQSPTARSPSLDAWDRGDRGAPPVAAPIKDCRGTCWPGPARGAGTSLQVGVCLQVSQRGAASPWVSFVTFPREVLLLAASLPPHNAGKQVIHKEPSLGLKSWWECDNGTQALAKGVWPPKSPRSKFRGVECLNSVPPGLPSAPYCGLEVLLGIGIAYSPWKEDLGI